MDDRRWQSRVTSRPRPGEYEPARELYALVAEQLQKGRKTLSKVSRIKYGLLTCSAMCVGGGALNSARQGEYLVRMNKAACCLRLGLCEEVGTDLSSSYHHLIIFSSSSHHHLTIKSSFHSVIRIQVYANLSIAHAPQ